MRRDRRTSMGTKDIARRQFIKGSAAGLAAAGLTSSAKSYARIVGANDRVGVGIVGFSDRTRTSLLPAFSEFAKKMNFEITAVSDLWKLRREQGLTLLEKTYAVKAAGAR